MSFTTPVHYLYISVYVLYFFFLIITMTSLAVRWIAYVSQDETTEVPMRFRTTNWLTEHDIGEKTYRHTPLM